MSAKAPTFRNLHFEARDATRNLARRYSVTVSLDLFGATVVDLAWGRIGRAGQHRRHAFLQAEAAERFVTQVLRRRARAPRRIGVAYQPVPSR